MEKHLNSTSLTANNDEINNNSGGNKKKGQNKGVTKLKDIVFKMIPCLFPQVIEHILLENNIDPDSKL